MRNTPSTRQCSVNWVMQSNSADEHRLNSGRSTAVVGGGKKNPFLRRDLRDGSVKSQSNTAFSYLRHSAGTYFH